MVNDAFGLPLELGDIVAHVSPGEGSAAVRLGIVTELVEGAGMPVRAHHGKFHNGLFIIETGSRWSKPDPRIKQKYVIKTPISLSDDMFMRCRACDSYGHDFDHPPFDKPNGKLHP